MKYPYICKPVCMTVLWVTPEYINISRLKHHNTHAVVGRLSEQLVCMEPSSQDVHSVPVGVTRYGWSDGRNSLLEL